MKNPRLPDIMRDPAAALHRILRLEKVLKDLCKQLAKARKVLKKDKP